MDTSRSSSGGGVLGASSGRCEPSVGAMSSAASMKGALSAGASEIVSSVKTGGDGVGSGSGVGSGGVSRACALSISTCGSTPSLSAMLRACVLSGLICNAFCRLMSLFRLDSVTLASTNHAISLVGSWRKDALTSFSALGRSRSLAAATAAASSSFADCSATMKPSIHKTYDHERCYVSLYPVLAGAQSIVLKRVHFRLVASAFSTLAGQSHRISREFWLLLPYAIALLKRQARGNSGRGRGGGIGGWL